MSAASMHREDAAWLAGLLDGEGCFDSPRGNPRVRVKMGDLDVVLRAAGIMDAQTHEERDYRPTVDGSPRTSMKVATVTGDKAVAVMLAVLPWMGARRSTKISEIIEAHKAKKAGKIRLARIGTVAAPIPFGRAA